MTLKMAVILNEFICCWHSNARCVSIHVNNDKQLCCITIDTLFITQLHSKQMSGNHISWFCHCFSKELMLVRMYYYICRWKIICKKYCISKFICISRSIVFTPLSVSKFAWDVLWVLISFQPRNSGTQQQVNLKDLMHYVGLSVFVATLCHCFSKIGSLWNFPDIAWPFMHSTM